MDSAEGTTDIGQIKEQMEIIREEKRCTVEINRVKKAEGKERQTTKKLQECIC